MQEKDISGAQGSEDTSTELIIVRQLPEIEEHLRNFKDKINEEVEKATSLVCTEETLASVREARANLNKAYKKLDSQRIDVKKQILEPYESFESVYRECVAVPFCRGDEILKRRISEVENALKDEKAGKASEYYKEYCSSKGIDFIPFERLGLNITLTVSLKKLKEQAKAFIDKVSDEIVLIASQEHSEEILVEYKQSLNVAQAITTVGNRHKAIEEERLRREAAQAEAEAKAAAIGEVEEAVKDEGTQIPLAAPQVEKPGTEENEKIYEVTFTVHGTREKIKALKTYLIEGGYIDG